MALTAAHDVHIINKATDLSVAHFEVACLFDTSLSAFIINRFLLPDEFKVDPSEYYLTYNGDTYDPSAGSYISYESDGELLYYLFPVLKREDDPDEPEEIESKDSVSIPKLEESLKLQREMRTTLSNITIWTKKNNDILSEILFFLRKQDDRIVKEARDRYEKERLRKYGPG